MGKYVQLLIDLYVYPSINTRIFVCFDFSFIKEEVILKNFFSIKTLVNGFR